MMMLYLRILSALIGIPVVLGAVYLGGPWFTLFMLILVNLGMFEYNRILKVSNVSFNAFLSFFGVSMFIIVLYLDQQLFIMPLVVLLLFVLFVSALFRMENGEKNTIDSSALTLWGIIYIGGLCGYLFMLRMQPSGLIYTYILLAGIWIHDTLAYFIGSRWGYRKFAPQVSPKKSVEGSLAGFLGTITIFFSAAILLPGLMSLSPGRAVVLALGISVFGQLGDLMESALKRQVEVKDSGSIIPGHGGILDRFDSLMLAAPFVYYYFMFSAMF